MGSSFFIRLKKQSEVFLPGHKACSANRLEHSTLWLNLLGIAFKSI
jgi:hypothetical protein